MTRARSPSEQVSYDGLASRGRQLWGGQSAAELIIALDDPHEAEQFILDVAQPAGGHGCQHGTGEAIYALRGGGPPERASSRTTMPSLLATAAAAIPATSET